MEVLSSKQTLEEDLHITSDEENDILTDKRKSEIKKKQKVSDDEDKRF